MLEDGACVHLVLRNPEFGLDVQHRDHQGRTLSLSVYRSSIGADVAVDSVVVDASTCYIISQFLSIS